VTRLWSGSSWPARKALGLGAAVAVGEVGRNVAVEQLVGERPAVVDGLGGGEGEAKQRPPRPRPHDHVTEERHLREVDERSLVARGPVVVGLGVRNHESVEAVGVLGGEQLRERAAVIVTDNVGALDAQAIEYTGSHSRSVVVIAREVGVSLAVSELVLREIEFGAPLHDVIKMAVPNEILNKPAALTDDEMRTVWRHTLEGERMLERIGGMLGEMGPRRAPPLRALRWHRLPGRAPGRGDPARLARDLGLRRLPRE
jgi:hypothetical protein